MASKRSRVLPLCDTVYIFENTTLLYTPKSILGLFPSLVIDEIKCFEGGHFTLEGDSLP